ncbi:unnamed protein product [Cuscuta epithymum]|uniref:Uncharacterized protein n=1 Tax=Cuscuta epithymum TaxID=186058 RepID=A0AAV0FQQ1_9ASTE|nr:unnamed protein product [Cuscuta epithymum]
MSPVGGMYLSFSPTDGARLSLNSADHCFFGVFVVDVFVVPSVSELASLVTSSSLLIAWPALKLTLGSKEKACTPPPPHPHPHPPTRLSGFAGTMNSTHKIQSAQKNKIKIPGGAPDVGDPQTVFIFELLIPDLPETIPQKR